MQYFDHSTTASVDDKVVALRLEHGGAAVDAYWVVLEQIYRDETPLVFYGNRHANRSLCHRLSVGSETLETWFSTMLEIGLLEIDSENPDALTSERAMKNIKAYREKCETARQNGKKGGRKPTKKPNANQSANQTLTDAETKRKTNKTKQNKDIGLHKVNQISITPAVVAAAAKAAPPAGKTAFCPECQEKLWKGTGDGKWHCPSCHEALSVEEAAWA